MLVVCYFEKALYELNDEEMTPENVTKMARSIEKELTMMDASALPVMAVPHIISGEASAYYHGYVLAEMAVYQTREYFLRTDGHLMDNPNIGKKMAKHYWNAGNSKHFFDFIENLTGEPFSAKATNALLSKSIEDVLKEADTAETKEKQVPINNEPIDLNASVELIHGDEIIASSDNGGFDKMAADFKSWVNAKA